MSGAPTRSIEEHLVDVLALATVLPPVAVGLAEAAGLVLAEEVLAEADLPRWDNSAMDGYAVRAADTADASRAPVALVVVADLPAGSPARPLVEHGTAARIMTGAPIPPGADAVVPVEDTDAGTTAVTIGRPARPGAHIRCAGEDLRRGEQVLSPGVELTATRLAAASAAGRGAVLAHPAPRVAVLATGSELVPPGSIAGAGQIPDSNSVLMAAAVRAAGGEVIHAGMVADDAAAFASLLDGFDGVADLVVTAGGVSMGAFEVVRDVLEPTGRAAFMTVAMQPGKPQGLGRLGRGTPVVCLPGNPVSAFVSFEMFVRPLILAMRGLATPDGGRVVEPAVVDDSWTPPRGRTQLMPVAVSGPAGARTVRRASTGGSGSHLVAGLAQADGLLVVPAGTPAVRRGDTFRVRMTP